MHGGGAGSGAPSGKGNGNYRHGGNTKEATALMRHINMLARQLRLLNKK
jgi:hypothetical protein